MRGARRRDDQADLRIPRYVDAEDGQRGAVRTDRLPARRVPGGQGAVRGNAAAQRAGAQSGQHDRGPTKGMHQHPSLRVRKNG